MRLQFLLSQSTNPYENVAVENYLVGQPDDDIVTLYLWKNHRTVVIGQNQNPYSECNLEALEKDGGHLMRRKTGGGAVYHDEGNINFSFIAPPSLYDQGKQFSVLMKAVAAYGLKTELSGRNDVLCDGRKFSGNAFSKGRTHYLHHGTILIKGNMEDLAKYLKVKPSKLLKHGVSSVRSRVVNLSELAPVTSDNIVPILFDAFSEVYGGKPEVLDFSYILHLDKVEQLTAEFASDEWRLGRWQTFVAQRSRQFDWGYVEISIDVNQDFGVISHVSIATDALDVALIEQAENLFTGASIHDSPSVDNDQLRQIVDLVYNE